MKQVVKKLLRPFYNPLKEYYEKFTFTTKLNKQQNEGRALKLVIGSSRKYDEGWIPTEAHFLNLLDEATWDRYFTENQISNMLAEHVWEHLTIDEGRKAASVCYKYLKHGGRLRVAVPDGFHSNQQYIDYVKPGGFGDGADDHKVLYNYKTFSSVFEDSGFRVDLLEYFDEQGNFQTKKWDIENGLIKRSIKYDKRNVNEQPVYTSLIIDAIKL
ncbi:MAG: hypothetical protein AMXMBFR79_18190 [Chitinophagaceae bacterium]